MLNGLDLFSGIGGLSLALGEWVEPIAYCENDRYAQAVLLDRISNGSLPHAPIWDDICTLKGEYLPPINMVYGGFPCQDISIAGNGVGLEGKRSGLFFEMLRLIEEIKPTFVFLENVPAIRTRGAERVGKELAIRGYDCRWEVVSAAEVGANHERKRWFMLAHAWCEGLEGLEHKTTTRKTYAMSRDLVLPKIKGKNFSEFYRKDNGLPVPVDEVRALGNAVVPLQAKRAFMMLSGLLDPAKLPSLKKDENG